MKTSVRVELARVLLCASCITAYTPLAVGDEAEGVPAPTLQNLAAHVLLVQEAYGILRRTVQLAPADLARSRELVAELDVLLASRQRYFDWLDELKRTDLQTATQTSLIPRLRQLRDSHRSYLDSLPEDFAGRQTIRAQMQQLSLAMALEERSSHDVATGTAELISELSLHAGVFVRTAFAHFEVAKARLQRDILHRAVSRQAKDILATLDAEVLPLLEFNAAVVGDSRLARRPTAADGGLIDQLRAYGEYHLRGAPFDAQQHCELAEFKALQALSALAQRLGVVLHGETRESCVQVGATVRAWLAVPQANLADALDR